MDVQGMLESCFFLSSSWLPPPKKSPIVPPAEGLKAIWPIWQPHSAVLPSTPQACYTGSICPSWLSAADPEVGIIPIRAGDTAPTRLVAVSDVALFLPNSREDELWPKQSG